MLQTLSKKARRLWATVALLSAEMVVIVVLFLASLLALAFLIRRVIFLQNTRFDKAVFALLDQHISPRNNELMLGFTFLGTHRFLIPANLALIGYFLFVRKHKWYSIKIPAIALSSLALMFGLKYLFGRPRPEVPLLFEAEGLSFPSGHALFSVTFYGLLIYLIHQRLKPGWPKQTLVVLLVMLIFIIGFSRVYLRVHYATDVLAGFCVGFLWLVFSIWLLNRVEQYSKRRLDPAVRQPVQAT